MSDRFSTFIILAFSLFLLPHCSSSVGTIYVEMHEPPGAVLGPAVPCENCTAFSTAAAEGIDGNNFMHLLDCPQVDDADPDFDLTNMRVFSLSCTDSDGIAILAASCLDFSTDCGANVETFDVYGISLAPDDSSMESLQCCMVTSYNSPANAFQFSPPF